MSSCGFRVAMGNHYQLLPYMFDKAAPSERSVVLVILPLVSLMIGQGSGLQKRGVPV